MAIIQGKIFLTLLLLSSSVFSIATSRSSSNIDWWCNQTPHPEPCKYYLKQKQQHLDLLKHKSKFREVLIHLALLERSLIMQRQARDFGQNSVTMKQKSVLGVCLKLYDNTVFHLNRTLQGLKVRKGCSSFDAQTWLSTALTNIETCRTEALEFSVPDFIGPTPSSNVTKIISNSLAVNYCFTKNEASHYTQAYEEDGFPNWILSHEKKMQVKIWVLSF